MKSAALIGVSSKSSYQNLSKTIKLLAIDTSTDACSAALLLSGNILAHYELAPRLHTRLLLPMIDSLLKEASLTLSELDALAFGRGPGSFTGVRIASSVVQAFGFGFQKPIVPVSTLRALAQNAYHEQGAKKVFASLDARMQEIYWGLFEVDERGIMQSISTEHVQSPNDVTIPKDYIQITGYPHAKEIAVIAAAEYALDHVVSAQDAIPVYIRDDVAKKS